MITIKRKKIFNHKEKGKKSIASKKSANRAFPINKLKENEIMLCSLVTNAR